MNNISTLLKCQEEVINFELFRERFDLLSIEILKIWPTTNANCSKWIIYQKAWNAESSLYLKFKTI